MNQPAAGTQNARVLAYIRAHPGATVQECAAAMEPWISNIRARHSDLRLRGFDVVCERRPDGFDGFRLVDGPMTLGLDHVA